MIFLLLMIVIKIAIKGVLAIVLKKMTPPEHKRLLAKEKLRKIMGPPTRKIIGDELKKLLVIFDLIGPEYASNNQHSYTEVYRHAGKEYHLHIFDDEMFAEEVLDDEV